MAQVAPEKAAKALRAAAYVRMSTDYQRYSSHNQLEVILRYADAHDLRIVRTYADEGKSGLTITDRRALQQLLEDVESGVAEYGHLLVYDVSRWGRFQDTDEGAYYEFRCRSRGVRVHYCAEQFDNSGSAMAAVLKSLKRAMAAEFSRELSEKVFLGQCTVFRQGFHAAGRPGLGFRRLLVDMDGKPKGVLQDGERKSLMSDRVIVVPGPREEREVVRRIFRNYVEDGMTSRAIAAWMNEQGVPTYRGGPWTRIAVDRLLRNPRYVGKQVFNRTSTKLKQRRVDNPPDRWIWTDSAHAPIVPPDLFMKAQQLFEWRGRGWTDEKMLDALRGILKENGRITNDLIDRSRTAPTARIYRHRFGSLGRVYELIGYEPIRKKLQPIRTAHSKIKTRLARDIAEAIRSRGGEIDGHLTLAGARIDDAFTLRIVVLSREQMISGRERWIKKDPRRQPSDFYLVALMDAASERVLEYRLVGPGDLAPNISLAFGPDRESRNRGRKVRDLSKVYGMCRETRSARTSLPRNPELQS